MAANDGPVPVRALAFAARLMRDARQLPRYGITTSEPALQLRPAAGARARSRARREHALGPAREDRCARRDGLRAGRRGPLHRPAHDRDRRRTSARSGEVHPLHRGREPATRHSGLSSSPYTHSDAWKLTEVPPSMLVIGGGNTGVQIASMFHAFGSKVQLFERGARILRCGGRVGGRGRHGRSSRVGRGGARTIRRDHFVREDAERSAHELPRRPSRRAAPRRRWSWWPPAG